MARKFNEHVARSAPNDSLSTPKHSNFSSKSVFPHKRQPPKKRHPTWVSRVPKTRGALHRRANFHALGFRQGEHSPPPKATDIIPARNRRPRVSQTQRPCHPKASQIRACTAQWTGSCAEALTPPPPSSLFASSRLYHQQCQPRHYRHFRNTSVHTYTSPPLSHPPLALPIRDSTPYSICAACAFVIPSFRFLKDKPLREGLGFPQISRKEPFFWKTSATDGLRNDSFSG